LIEISDNVLLSLPESKSIPSDGYQLAEIYSDFVISDQILKNSIYYDTIFSKIKYKEDALAMFILSEIKKEQSSIFYFYFLNLLEKRSPILYDYEDIQLLESDQIYMRLSEDTSRLKSAYIDLRRLVFSYDAEFRNEFIGSFLYGDYLWAL
jgi:hypothetical protein